MRLFRRGLIGIHITLKNKKQKEKRKKKNKTKQEQFLPSYSCPEINLIKEKKKTYNSEVVGTLSFRRGIFATTKYYEEKT